MGKPHRYRDVVRILLDYDSRFEVVTLRGEPVAVLRPLPERSARELRQVERQEALAKLDELAERVASAWRSPESAVALVDEQRR
jgi:hypothetical protein